MSSDLISHLTMLAESAVAAELDRLPESVRTAAAECPVFFTTISPWAAREGEVADEELLGLFTGASRLEPTPASPEESPQVTLFLDNLWSYCEEDEKGFKEEAALTYLHELGHYLGWDEMEVAARGLA